MRTFKDIFPYLDRQGLGSFYEHETKLLIKEAIEELNKTGDEKYKNQIEILEKLFKGVLD